MKNFFGEEVEITPIRFIRYTDRIAVLRGEEYCGLIQKNTYNGYVRNIKIPKDDFIIVVNGNNTFSIAELSQIIKESETL